MKREHRKKMTAPIVITVLFVLYLIVYAALVIRDAGWSPAMLLLTIPLVALGLLLLFNLIRDPGFFEIVVNINNSGNPVLGGNLNF